MLWSDFPQQFVDIKLWIVYDIYMKTRTKSKLMSFSDRHLDMIDALMAELGWDRPVDICRRGIEELYTKTFKYGKDPLANLPGSDTDTALTKKAETKAKEKEAIAAAEEVTKQRPKIKICERTLGGKVTENESGKKFCEYTLYTLIEDRPEIIPLDQVSPLLAETSLFMPSRNVIFNERKEVERKFKKLEDNK